MENWVKDDRSRREPKVCNLLTRLSTYKSELGVVMRISAPIYSLLRQFDALREHTSFTLHDVLKLRKQIFDQCGALDETARTKLEAMWRLRTKELFTPLAIAGYLLHPLTYYAKWSKTFSNHELFDPFLAEDLEIRVIKGFKRAIKTILTDEDDCLQFWNEYELFDELKFQFESKTFGGTDLIWERNDRGTKVLKSPLEWWAFNRKGNILNTLYENELSVQKGSMLFQVVKVVYTQSLSQTECERDFKKRKRVFTKERQRLDKKLADKLVVIHDHLSVQEKKRRLETNRCSSSSDSSSSSLYS